MSSINDSPVYRQQLVHCETNTKIKVQTLIPDLGLDPSEHCVA